MASLQMAFGGPTAHFKTVASKRTKMLSNEPVLRTGCLLKKCKGNRIRSYNKREFTLTSSTLSYCHGRRLMNERAECDKVQTVFDLTQLLSVQKVAGDGAKFLLTFPGKVLTLRAPTPNMADEWVSMIEEANMNSTRSAATTPDSGASMQSTQSGMPTGRGVRESWQGRRMQSSSSTSRSDDDDAASRLRVVIPGHAAGNDGVSPRTTVSSSGPSPRYLGDAKISPCPSPQAASGPSSSQQPFAAPGNAAYVVDARSQDTHFGGADVDYRHTSSGIKLRASMRRTLSRAIPDVRSSSRHSRVLPEPTTAWV